MGKITINKLLQTDKVINNVEQKKDLNELLPVNSYTSGIYNYLTSITHSACGYLLNNISLARNNPFVAIHFEAGKIYDQLMNLIFRPKQDLTSMYSMFKNDLEIALSNGMSLNNAAKIILSHNSYNCKKEIESQLKLVEWIITKDAKLSEANAAKIILSHNSYNCKKEIESQLKLVEWIITKGAKLSEANNVSPYLSNEIYEYMLKHELKPSVLLNAALSLEPGERHNQLVDFALAHKIDFASADSLPSSVSISDLEKCLKNGMTANLALKYAISNNLIEIAKFAFSHGADVNFVTPGEDFRPLMGAMFRENMEMVDFLISHSNKVELTPFECVILESITKFDFMTRLMKKTPCSKDQIYELSRSHGASQSESQILVDIFDLMNEYALTKDGESTSLGEMDMKMLDTNITIENIEELKDAKFTNKYGYGPLHLSLIGNKNILATEMIKSGFDMYAKNHNNITSLQFLENIRGEGSAELIATILEVIDDIDFDLGSGETLVDILIDNDDLATKIIEQSHDLLFTLLKEDADLFSLSKDLNKTNIAISDGEGFWSTGAWSSSRLIANNHKDVVFYLVRPEMLKKGGEAFLKQFDAVINPGADDSYPKLEEFTKDDCSLSMPLEIHYQTMLEQTDHLNIPYLGICAGAQHFSMYHGGSLKPLEGYSQGQHQVNFIEGSLPYFMSLTKAQQSKALSDCEFPKISFKGDTAHHYAAVNDKLGNNMQLGAVSEDGIAMSYANNNGIRYATQFHPEHHYDNNDVNAIHQIAWLDNFVEIAQLHHNYRVHNESHPIEYFAQVKLRLDECLVGLSSHSEEL